MKKKEEKVQFNPEEDEPTDEQLSELMRRVAESLARKAKSRDERFRKMLHEQIARAAAEL